MKALKLSLAACALIGSSAFAGTDDASMDMLLEKLVEKGVFKVDEASDIAAEIKKAVAERNKDLAKDKDFKKELMGKNIDVTSHAKKIDFSGTHYIGFSSNSYGAKNAVNGSNGDNGFEFRRNYIQAKAYLTDKDYLRVTLDTTNELESNPGSVKGGYANTYVKYAYLWLNDVLPYTGAEIGVAHRPWIDYEEHNSWYYRSINKVVLEDKFSVNPTSAKNVGVDALNSADLGVNFKTKTDYFSSELGLFNGEGYHPDYNQVNDRGMSFEWRLTGHLLGTGTKVSSYKPETDTYADVSFAGMMSHDHKYDGTSAVSGAYDRTGYWLHGVYNQPEFLITAQYDKVKDDYNAVNSASNVEKSIYSVGGEYRPIKNWSILARYDSVDAKYQNNASNNDNKVGDATQWIYGVAYTYNKNVKFIVSGKTVDAKDKTLAGASFVDGTTKTVGDTLDKQSYMLTTEVNW